MTDKTNDRERDLEKVKAATERMLEPRYSYHPELDERHIKHNGTE